MGMATLDHLVVSGKGLAEVVDHVETTLGLPMGSGGAHPDLATHNRLLSLGTRDYLEAIAPDPEGGAPSRARFFDLDRVDWRAKLANWVMRVDDLEAALAEAPEGVGEIVSLSRGVNRWRMTIPADGRLPFDGLFPAFIQWDTPQPAPRLSDVGLRLIKLTLSHPKAGALGWALAPFLDDDRVLIKEGPVGMSAVIFTGEEERLLT